MLSFDSHSKLVRSKEQTHFLFIDGESETQRSFPHKVTKTLRSRTVFRVSTPSSLSTSSHPFFFYIRRC